MKSFLQFEDPLSEEAIRKLLSHREEDVFVDYKESFDPADEKQWLGLTKDVMAFANTMGGYIVYGIEDSKFSIVGLSETATKALADTNMVMQKVNRHVEPSFTQIRAKKVEIGGDVLVTVFVPESKGRTHIVAKHATVEVRGKQKNILVPGMIFVRRSATNQIIDANDLNFIIERRIDHFRESLFEKITRVVEAPIAHDVLVFDPRSTSDAGKTFTISDGPDAKEVKGMSFTIVPRSDVEELAGWIALTGRDPLIHPGRRRLWRLYSLRCDFRVGSNQLAHLVKFCLIGEVPVFYWLREMNAEDIKESLSEAMAIAPNIHIKADILHVGAFLGKGFHTNLLRKIGNDIERLNPRSRKFPKPNPQAICRTHRLEARLRDTAGLSDEKQREALADELTAIANQQSQRTDVMKTVLAKALDCYLYGRDDKYISKDR